MPIKYRDISKILKDLGYVLVAQKGSHQKFRQGVNCVEVPKHEELAIGTARNIVKSIATQNSSTIEDISRKYGLKF